MDSKHPLYRGTTLAVVSKYSLYGGAARRYTILSGCALEQYLNSPFCRTFNSGGSIWSDPGGSKFARIMYTQGNLDIMFVGARGREPTALT
jgi:hypothetical protein